MENTVIGIDIGSISISIAQLTSDKEIVNSAYAFHEGHIDAVLERMLRDFDLSSVAGIAVTSSTPPLVEGALRYDSRVSFISAARHLHNRVGSILIVGGEKFGLVLFDENGEYLNYRSNTSCAAGTGSFLDQQSRRLNLKSIEDFSETAFNNRGDIPKIASRCAVFAKTDLIHAQQEGYSLEEICDGLCYGLVKNIADTLFSNVKPTEPLVFIGGVSKNRAVVKHFSTILDTEIITHSHSQVYGAIGAALNLIDDNAIARPRPIASPRDIIKTEEKVKRYYYEPLRLTMSSYPDFESREKYEQLSKGFSAIPPVEVDIYEDLARGEEYPVHLGIDIGSTSTKAVLLDDDKRVLAGFYTRTSGRPIEAVQSIFEIIDDLGKRKGVEFAFLSAGTTGSGRKFIASIIGADIALDEITAHARAARELDEDVDTIIEIGGQDSKFTTMRNGMVTFSIMNNVCAAGTGSFIEEQAKKLGCPLPEYSQRAEDMRAPLSSDRCTVFMERDLNYYLSEGYSVNEVLASVLHSVRENYLTKVAIEKNIGGRIFFQGATAKNKALVAAFEQRLGKPIMVSQFCHLTGALGVALHLRDSSVRTAFRGIEIHKHKIPVRSEVCDLCTNHCKLRIATVDDDTVAFGFLCGRDYDTKKFVREDRGFDLIRERERIFKLEGEGEPGRDLTIGIPAALHIYEELPLWKKFFHILGLRVVTSENYREGIKDGKNLTGAEFCAPVAAFHGHVNYLSDRADYLFLPHYIEHKQKSKKKKRTYCYYTQYSSPVVMSAIGIRKKERILSPLIHTTRDIFHTRGELFRMLKGLEGCSFTFSQVSQAYDSARTYYSSRLEELQRLFRDESGDVDDVQVVFVGRPYTIMSRSMNNGIPNIFARHGIKTYYQDMIETDEEEVDDIDTLLSSIHWKYAAKILETASAVARRDGLYPVLVTSFKCTPDSYVIEYFKRILDAHGKPYLILQLDEHDSSVGYETRIEAAIRAFRNHYGTDKRRRSPEEIFADLAINRNKDALKGKTVLLPNWDNLTCTLLEAALRGHGIDARVIEESQDSIMRSMSFNTGQCLPLNIIIQNTIDYIAKYNLDPERTIVWSIDSKISCNVGMFPFYTKTMLEASGRGHEKIPVYMGDITFLDFSVMTSIGSYLAFMFGGMMRKISCRLRPYERVAGSTDRAVAESKSILYDAFERRKSKEEALDRVMSLFEAIETAGEQRPKVAIFGDLYVRDNDIMNQDLIGVIERNGGEVITTPYSEFINIVADQYIKKWFKQGMYQYAVLTKVLRNLINILDKKYYKFFNRVIDAPRPINGSDPDSLLSSFGLRIHHTGESMENILKIFHLLQHHPDLALFVQTNPSYCCPSLVTEAMADKIERLTGVPVVTIEYDGTGSSKNEDVIPYLKYPRKKGSAAYEDAI